MQDSNELWKPVQLKPPDTPPPRNYKSNITILRKVLLFRIELIFLISPQIEKATAHFFKVKNSWRLSAILLKTLQFFF